LAAQDSQYGVGTILVTISLALWILSICIAVERKHPNAGGNEHSRKDAQFVQSVIEALNDAIS